MLKVKRLNLDSSWHWDFGEVSCIVDPWLVGSEIDGFSWFNEQWHSKDPVSIDELPHYDFILITQNYEDHCHLNTLKEISKDKPLYATAQAFKKLQKHFPDRSITLLPDSSESINVKGLEIYALRPNRKMDPIYYSVVLKKGDNTIFCAPHGFTPTENQQEILSKEKIKILISTFTRFELPSILGGLVNPGMENVVQLFQYLSPEVVINTHDEKKIGKGLISKIAKVKYADYSNIEKDYNMKYLHIPDYKQMEI